MAGIVFHSMEGSSYLWSVMQIADEKGVPYELKVPTLHSPEHFKLHPFGKMPVLQHGEVILYESLAIAHYIDKAFDGPPLQPRDALGQAQVLRWISIVNSYVFPVMNRFFKERIVRPAWGFETDQAFVDTAKAPLELQVRLIDEAAGAEGFLVGNRLTIADCFLFPNLLFFSLTTEGAALLAQYKGATDWLARMRARPSYPGSIMQRSFGETAKLAEGLRQMPLPVHTSR
ncbi:MAG: glutathione S-transferase family protein [Rhizomicrobium sp.]